VLVLRALGWTFAAVLAGVALGFLAGLLRPHRGPYRPRYDTPPPRAD